MAYVVAKKFLARLVRLGRIAVNSFQIRSKYGQPRAVRIQTMKMYIGKNSNRLSE
jgi:hypothetical protein